MGGGFLLVIVLNLFNALGRFLGGSVSDKIGRGNTLKITLIVQALNMILFQFYTTVPIMVLGILIQGFCYGTIFAVMPTLTADLYGLKNFGSNYGAVFLAWGIGGVIGTLTAARFYDSTGSYNTAYLVACVLSLISLVFVFIINTKKSTVQNAISEDRF